MSAIAEARGWAKTADQYWAMAKAETDPGIRADMETLARYWEEEAEHAWRDAKSEADQDAAYDDDHQHDDEGRGS